MSVMHALAVRLARTSYGRKASESKADLSVFKEPPSVRLVIGLVLLAISFTIGWPAVGATGIAALYLKNPLIFLIGGPIAYLISHLVWTLSMFLIGRDNIMYMNVLIKYFTRVIIEKYASDRLGSQGANKSSEGAIGSPSKKSIDKEYPPRSPTPPTS